MQLKILSLDIKTFKPCWWLYAPPGVAFKHFAFCRRNLFLYDYGSQGKQQCLYKALTYGPYDRVDICLQHGTTWILKGTALSIFVYKMFCTSSLVSLVSAFPCQLYAGEQNYIIYKIHALKMGTVTYRIEDGYHILCVLVVTVLIVKKMVMSILVWCDVCNVSDKEKARFSIRKSCLFFDNRRYPHLNYMYTRVKKNPSAWNFLSPKLEVTCGTVAIIIRVLLLSPYLRIRAVSLSSIHYSQSHRVYINRRRQYICLIWN